MKTRRAKAKKPARLKKGDTIGIVAPAWSLEPWNFRRGVDMLRKLGYKVKYDRKVYNQFWSMAGFDIVRANQINQMFADKEVKAVFCAKAGYGSIRTIPYLDAQVIKENPKIFVGYSDITILLSYLYSVANMVVFHGPLVSGEIHADMNPETLDYLLRAVAKRRPIGELAFPAMKTIRPGNATGTIVGGNISLFMNTIGTPYEVDTNEKILFFEDISEDLEVIDSYLMQLKLAGKLQNIKGMVFGKMVGCTDTSGKKYTLKKILDNILRDSDVPVINGLPSGHRIGKECNVTLPLGVTATIDATKINEPKLIINESGVR